jgi:divalent metal cation (Fe/Co/Zn/Cd) transporter
MGESASPKNEALIRQAVEAEPQVRRLIHMRTEHLGPDELLVAAKLELAGDLTFAEVADAINATEARLRAAVPSARVVYLEPDVVRDAPLPAAD